MFIMKCTDVFLGVLCPLWGGVEWGEGGYVGGSFQGGIYHEGKKISMKGAQGFLALLKKNNDKMNK